MMPLIVITGLGLLPLLLVMVWRSNAAAGFLAVCLGMVLSSVAAPDIADAITTFTPVDALASLQWVRLALLILPLILTLFMLRRTVSAGKQLLGFLPALAAGVLLTLFAVPLLPAALQKAVQAEQAWHILNNLQVGALLAGAALSILMMGMTASQPGGETKHKKGE